MIVTDDLPDGTVFQSAEVVVGAGTCGVVPPDTVTCSLGDLAPGETNTIVITVFVEADPGLCDTQAGEHGDS